MATGIYQLPDEELASAYSAAVEAVRERLAWEGMTYSSLAESIGVREDSLKKFVNRHDEVVARPLAIRRGSVFYKVHSALVAKGGLPEVPSDRRMSPAQKLKGYSFINAMLGVRANAMIAAQEMVLKTGRFLCFRNSTDRARLEVSEIAFTNLATKDAPIWEFSHHFTEGDQSQRVSDGPVIVMNNIIYMFGDVQLGESLEIIVLRTPTQGARFISGFIFSRDHSGSPFVANVLLIEAMDSETDLNELDIRKINEPCFVKKGQIKITTLGDDQDFGKMLLDQLKIPKSDDLLRMKRNKIMDDFSFVI